LPPADQRSSGETKEVPDFREHIVPLLSRAGCNGRVCRGSFQSQGGFRLSLFGYELGADHKALTDGGEKARVNLADPAASLILRKPTKAVKHKGGKFFDTDDWEYRLLRAWIQGGAKREADGEAAISLEVTPPQIVFSKVGELVSLKVIAEWSDGHREDVTPLCRFRTNTRQENHALLHWAARS
jgi:hypothetical protein